MITLSESDNKVIIQVDEMTAGDLVSLLSKYPPDLKVTYPNQEGGFHPIHGIKPMKLALNVNDEYWYGKHDYPESIDPDELKTKTQEICLILAK